MTAPTLTADRPQLLDLCCCAGGASMGYHLAGFDVTGIDINPQPRYPFKFIQADALAYVKEYSHLYNAIVGSPPCQGYSRLNAYNGLNYPDLIAELRTALIATGKPWILENVPQAPLINPMQLCEPMFGLKMYREYNFEASFTFTAPKHSTHVAKCTRNGYLPTIERPYMSIHGGKHSRAWQQSACTYMGTPWIVAGPGMSALRVGIREVCEAIPPAYTRYLGKQLLAVLR